MSPILERVECAYCPNIPLKAVAVMLAERRSWVLWVCPDCAELACEIFWRPQNDPLPFEHKNRFKKFFNAQGD